MSKRKPYKRYSPEFKREALKRASEEGVTDRFICKELDISERQLRRWRDEFRLLGDDAFPGQGRSRDEEITRLKHELAKAKQERDFSYGSFCQLAHSNFSRRSVIWNSSSKRNGLSAVSFDDGSGSYARIGYRNSFLRRGAASLLDRRSHCAH